jgi:hypothetical protein
MLNASQGVSGYCKPFNTVFHPQVIAAALVGSWAWNYEAQNLESGKLNNSLLDEISQGRGPFISGKSGGGRSQTYFADVSAAKQETERKARHEFQFPGPIADRESDCHVLLNGS